MPQNKKNPQARNLLVSQKLMHFFPTLDPLSPVIFATATVVAFVLLRNSRFNFHCYPQREATPAQKLSWKWRCDHSRLLARKITEGIHACKPTSLNRPIVERDGVLQYPFQPGSFEDWSPFLFPHCKGLSVCQHSAHGNLQTSEQPKRNK